MNKWNFAAAVLELLAAGWQRDEIIRDIRLMEESGLTLQEITKRIRAMRDKAATDARAELEALHEGNDTSWTQAS